MLLHSPFRQALLALSEQAENGLECRDLQELPEDCPWFWGQGYTTQQFIEQVFAPIRPSFGGFVQHLLDRCVGILVVFFSDRWWLVYDMGHKERCFVGAEPNEDPQLSEEAMEAGWALPAALVELARIHDGFGCAYVDEFALDLDFFGGHDVVFPAKALTIPELFWSDGHLEDLLQTQQQEWSANPSQAQSETSLQDFLIFMTFSDGNGVGFVRKNDQVEQGDDVVVWRYQEPQTSPLSFFAFLQDHLIRTFSQPPHQLDDLD